MIAFEIADLPNQQFSTVLEGRRITMRLCYNVTTDRWSFDLSIDDNPVLHGRRIVTGVDLLLPFNFGIGVIFAAPIVGESLPDRANLVNGNVKMFQTTEAEIAAVSP